VQDQASCADGDPGGGGDEVAAQGGPPGVTSTVDPLPIQPDSGTTQNGAADKSASVCDGVGPDGSAATACLSVAESSLAYFSASPTS